jgi:PqqD family protein of HPr-rel-A system
MNALRQGRPLRKGDVWFRWGGSQRALYDARSGRVHLMNDAAKAVWELCDGETSPEEMVQAICELSGMHPDVIAEDVERILTDFDRAELITWLED